jgi:hypothetical protein
MSSRGGIGLNHAGLLQQLQQRLTSQKDIVSHQAPDATSISGPAVRLIVKQLCGQWIDAADALYSKIDPNNTGNVSEQQFTQYLQSQAPLGVTTQDLLRSLLDSATQSPSSTSTNSDIVNSTDTSPAGGSSVQEARSVQEQNADTTGGTNNPAPDGITNETNTASGIGSSAQDTAAGPNQNSSSTAQRIGSESVHVTFGRQ